MKYNKIVGSDTSINNCFKKIKLINSLNILMDPYNKGEKKNRQAQIRMLKNCLSFTFLINEIR